MVRFSVGESDKGKRVDRFLFLTCSQYPVAAIYKAFKNRDVKINGKRVKENTIINEGDVITLYLPVSLQVDEGTLSDVTDINANDESNVTDQYAANSAMSKNLEKTNDTGYTPDIVWNGSSLLIVNKPQGIIVQSEKEMDLEKQIQQWWLSNPESVNSELPLLCHRLDQNTGGLIMFAKSKETLNFTMSELKHHKINKAYLCMVAGTPIVPKATLHNWLEKDDIKGRVYIHETPTIRSLPIETSYQTLASNGRYSLLHVEIATGRTHQIRAQLARIGHPIVGDSKYGSNKINRLLKLHRQALWAYRLRFPQYLSGPLQDLSNITLTSLNIPWAILQDDRFDWVCDAIRNLSD